MKKTRRGRRRQPQVPEKDLYEYNEKIKVPEVMLISDEGPVGKMSTQEALEQAREYGSDLVLVAPKAEPPVAKIMDYSSFKYQKQKEARKQKASIKKTTIKVLRLSPRIGQHDLDVRMKKAIEFIGKGDKVKIEILLKGREKAHADVAFNVIKGFIKSMKENHEIKVETEPKKQGARIEAIFSAE